MTARGKTLSRAVTDRAYRFLTDDIKCGPRNPGTPVSVKHYRLVSGGIVTVPRQKSILGRAE